MSKLKWLTNITDPRTSAGTGFITRQEALEYLEGKIIGKPKATEKYSVEELEALGMIGAYREADREAIRRNP